MKIFLTGVSGFLGSHLAEEFVASQHSVKVLVRKTSRIKHLKSLPLKYIEGLLPDISDIHTDLQDCDAIVHAAGLTKALSSKEFFEVNELGTERLVDELLKCSKLPKVFLYISTIAVHNPTKDGNDFCLPSSQCHPLTIYGKSKLAGEKALERLKGKVKTYILRPPVLYGPRDKELLPIFKAVRWGIAPLYGAGNHQLSICYAADVAKAVVQLLNSSSGSDEIFCLDDGNIYDWKKMIQIISKIMNKKVLSLPLPPILFRIAARLSEVVSKISRKPFVFTPEKVQEMSQPDWICGYEKLNKKTGWKPKVNLEMGAIRTLEFYKKEGLIH